MQNILDGSNTGSVRTSGASSTIAAYAFAEGRNTTASAQNAHAEGLNTKAQAQSSHAEGNGTTAAALYSHAEGYATQTYSGADSSHVEGQETLAYGIGSHAEGIGTVSKFNGQHAEGQYNVIDTGGSGFRGQYVHIVGLGTTNLNRKNGHTIDWSGNGWFAGNVSAGTVQTPATPTNANDLTTKAYVDGIVGAIESLLSEV